MKHYNRRLAAGSAMAVALLVIVACGGEQTVASKSREAQKKGPPLGGDSHGGHSAGGADQGAPTDSAGNAAMPGMDHAKMPGQPMAGMDHSKLGQSMAGMDHAKMQGQPMAGMDHAKMPGQPMAGMDHSKMPGQPMPGMDHSKMQGQPIAGMDHGSMPGMQHGSTGAGNKVMSAPTTSSEMQRMSPAATLRADSFDAPVPISVSEAMKAAQGGGHGMQGITPVQDQETAKSKPAAVTVYTCPMHPEVTSTNPGSCPKCGMTLEKKK